jgi:hypothetical protein
MKLQNFEKAFIDERKLSEYCLNENHPIGKHKAKKFKEVLSFSEEDADELKEIVLNGVKEFEAEFSFEDTFGKRYYVDMIIHKFGKKIQLRTSWIIKKEEDFPRLTSCYIKKR